ncbi:MAG: aminoglycoside phosphotransferase family protein [Acidobacteriota bacterium]|nr:aminoglycoside phosphotransferase family protein [Acidobacteriota bacterium]
MLRLDEIAGVLQQFAIDGRLVSAEAIGSGHIHDTLHVTFTSGKWESEYILQRINRTIFPNVPALMSNMQRVTEHLAKELAGHPDAERRALTLIPTRNEATWCQDQAGEYWRCFRAIPRTRTFDAVESTEQAFQAAKAFGCFQRLLSSLPAESLIETIPGFHHTPSRFAALREAIANDVAGRMAGCKREIEFALVREPLSRVLVEANLPLRITHNDTKLNNVLFDEESGEGICVIDLDTVMPGLTAYDFGDMVRTTACAAAEDEQDLALVQMDFALFEALLRGFLEPVGSALPHAERMSLAQGGQVITFEQGIRFLTDYLRGDTYYKVHREGQNLDRCRAQFKLLASMEEQSQAVNALVEKVA